MSKNLFVLFCLCLPLISIGQSRQLVDSINKVIGPGYVLDVDTLPPYHSYSSFKEVDLNGDGKKEIIIAASLTDNKGETDSNRIFVLERKNSQLLILDASPPYEVDGRGPVISVKGQDLTVTHNFHHESNAITYHFNSAVKAYRMVGIEYFEVETNNPDTQHALRTTQKFNIIKQLLTLHTSINYNSDGNIDKEKTKQIPHKLPAGISLLLSDMKDPIYYAINYHVFLSEGPVYDQMMKY